MRQIKFRSNKKNNSLLSVAECIVFKHTTKCDFPECHKFHVIPWRDLDSKLDDNYIPPKWEYQINKGVRFDYCPTHKKYSIC